MPFTISRHIASILGSGVKLWVCLRMHVFIFRLFLFVTDFRLQFLVFFASAMLATSQSHLMFLSFIPLLIFREQGLQIVKLLFV
jgi:hypothetical protein